MLATFLRDLRASRKVASAVAQQSLGSHWTVQDNGALKRDFQFADFHEAKFFMTRYSDYCHKINMQPQWSNVYNRVSVTLHNSEFDGVTTKEVDAGKYLNMVSTVNIRESAAEDDVLKFEEIVQMGQIE